MKRKTHQIIADIVRRFLILFGVAAVIVVPYQPVFASLISPLIGPGDVYSSGNNLNGSLGNGGLQFQTTSQEFQLPSGLTVKDVLQTLSSTFVIASDDQLYAAGRNTYGELGIGNRDMQRVPVRFQLPVGLSAVSVHVLPRDSYDFEDVTYVLASDGQVYSAGSNYYGEMGYGGAQEHVTTPVRFQLPVGVNALEVSPHENTVYVRASDGKVYCAGWNSNGELGDGTTTVRTSPVVFPLPGGVSAVKLATYAGLYQHTAAVIGSDGKLYVAGQNYYGELGIGTTGAVQSTPVVFPLPGGVMATAAVIGDSYIGVTGSDGQMYFSGRNTRGGFGNGSAVNTSVPVKFQLPVGLTVVTFYPHVWDGLTMILASDGQVYGSGYNSNGNLGTGDTINRSTPVRYPLPVGVNATKVVATVEIVMVLGTDGNVYVNGENPEGQLGDGTMSTPVNTEVYPLPVGLSATDIAIPTRDYAYSAHVLANGRVFGSGNNDGGWLGDGTRTSSSMPTEMVLPSGVIAKKLYVYRDWHGGGTCALSTTDKLYCAGENTYGQLGTDNYTSYETDPQKMQLPTGVSALKMYINNSNYSLFALGSDHQLYGAGNNRYGEMGVGSNTDVFTPQRFQLPVGLTAVDAYFPSAYATLVIASDGQVYGAGMNSLGGYRGALGDGASVDRSTPVRYQLPVGVSATGFAKRVGAGSSSDVMIIGSDGQAYVSGDNSTGERGVGVATSVILTPTRFQIPVGLSVTKAWTTYATSIAITSDGQVYIAGNNFYGQLGNGTNTTSNVPVRFQLPVGVNAVDVIPGTENTFVLGSDGNLYGSGLNTQGQLGDGSNTNRNVPVRFALPVGLQITAAGNADSTGYITSVLTSDGSVYGAGVNQSPGYDGSMYSPLGTGAASASVATPFKFPLPIGVTAVKLGGAGTSVVASDGKVYNSGGNGSGELGIGAVGGVNVPTVFPLPTGETAVDAIKGFVLAASGNLYVSGCNVFANSLDPVAVRCNGRLGMGSSETQFTPSRYGLESGLRVKSFAAAGDIVTVMISPNYAVGGQTYCDANDNGVQDSGEGLLNAQTVSIYAAVSGVASGPALTTYSSQAYLSNTGVFFFDGLSAGDYILGITTDSGMLYSQPITVDGSGDGWILGNSQFVETVSSIGQAGHVCGTSTTVTPPVAPPLARTGDSQVRLLLGAGSLFCLALSWLIASYFRVTFIKFRR